MEDEWNQPDRGDYYLMMLGAEVRRILAKNPSSIKLNDLKLQFNTPNLKPTRTGIDSKHQLALAKSSWLSRVGVKKDSAESKGVNKVSRILSRRTLKEESSGIPPDSVVGGESLPILTPPPRYYKRPHTTEEE